MMHQHKLLVILKEGHLICEHPSSERHGEAVVTVVASQQDGCRITSHVWDVSGWSLHILPMHIWVFFGYSAFLSQTKNMDVSLTGNAKLSLGVGERMRGCLFVPETSSSQPI